jgi:hypothetical protein
MKYNITTIDRPESPIYPKPPIVHSIEIINIHNALSFSKFEDDYQTRSTVGANKLSLMTEKSKERRSVQEEAEMSARRARLLYIIAKTQVSAMIAIQRGTK